MKLLLRAAMDEGKSVLAGGDSMLDRGETINDVEKMFKILINLLEEQENVTVEYEIIKKEDWDENKK